MNNFPKKIVLMGYMGSGKSSIGKKLAKAIGVKFVDLDDFISEKEKLSISEIFDKKGEVYFRKKELEYLKELLLNDLPMILSLGGGTPTFFGAIELIKEHSFSIYLKAGVQKLFDNLKLKKSERPLITNISDDALQEYIAVHLFERSNYYLKADAIVEMDNKEKKDIVKEIVKLLSYSK